MTVLFLAGCAGLNKDRTYILDRTQESSFKPKCEKPGKEGDLVIIDGVSFYFTPARKYTFMGPPFLPVIPIPPYGLVKTQITLMLAPGWDADPKKWKIRIGENKEWLGGEAGQSRLGNFIAFMISDYPDQIELQYTGNSAQENFTARFNRNEPWTYLPVIGLQGEQTRGWLPGCAR